MLFPAPLKTLIGNYCVLLLHCVRLIVSNCDLKMKSMKSLCLGGDINLEELVKQGEISLDSAIKPNFWLLHLDTVPSACSYLSLSLTLCAICSFLGFFFMLEPRLRAMVLDNCLDDFFVPAPFFLSGSPVCFVVHLVLGHG